MTAQNSLPSLEQLWNDIATGTVPIDELMREGRRVRRRRRVAAVVSAAAAVAAIVAGVGLMGALMAPSGEHRQHLVAAAPEVPAGTRLVGAGRVALAVPEDWVTGGADGCLAASEAAIRTRQYPPPPAVVCPPRGEYSSVSVSRLASPGGTHTLRFATTRREVDGVEVLTGQGDCQDTGYCALSRYPTYVVVPSENVVFTLFGPARDQSTLFSIAASLQILPDGYTSVPEVRTDDVSAARRVLENAGLRAEYQPCGANQLCLKVVDGPLNTEPSAGTVVQKGSIIILSAY